MRCTTDEKAGEVAPQGDGGGAFSVPRRSIGPPSASQTLGTSPAISRAMRRPDMCNAGEERRTSANANSNLTKMSVALPSTTLLVSYESRRGFEVDKHQGWNKRQRFKNEPAITLPNTTPREDSRVDCQCDCWSHHEQMPFHERFRPPALHDNSRVPDCQGGPSKCSSQSDKIREVSDVALH